MKVINVSVAPIECTDNVALYRAEEHGITVLIDVDTENEEVKAMIKCLDVMVCIGKEDGLEYALPIED